MKTQNLMKNKGISAVNYIKKKEKNVMKGYIQIMPLNITNSGKLLKHLSDKVTTFLKISLIETW